ncbi:MAG TPA: putative quinol monooxygenase [Novosphingobium sp.]|nr:putative quinol monooxygenase [Novosphingobium sp.]
MTTAINSVTIAGHIDFDPADCPAVLLEARAHIEGARGQPGCVAYTWAFDPLVPGRVQVFEEWDSEQALHDHFAGPHYRDMGGHLAAVGMRGFSIKMYGVAVLEPVYDENNRPRPLFFAGKR